jgi:VanZ family protein
MKWIAALFGLFIIVIIVLANLGQLGILSSLNQIPYGDKIGHFILYGILTLLIDLALFGSLPHLSRQLIVLRVALILALFIGLEEFSQQYFPTRTFDLSRCGFLFMGGFAN